MLEGCLLCGGAKCEARGGKFLTLIQAGEAAEAAGRTLRCFQRARTSEPRGEAQTQGAPWACPDAAQAVLQDGAQMARPTEASTEAAVPVESGAEWGQLIGKLHTGLQQVLLVTNINGVSSR